jgi:hypothetical protein
MQFEANSDDQVVVGDGDEEQRPLDITKERGLWMICACLTIG